MPNDYIDLGQFTQYAWGYGVSGFRSADVDAYWLDLHAKIKTKMELENGGQNWQVDRLFKYTGGGGAYGFVIKHLSAGSATGREWLIFGSRATSYQYVANSYSYLQSNSLQLTYFRAVTNTGTTTSTVRAMVGMHYHSGGLSTTYDVGAGNDLDPPNTLPSTDLVGFLPDFATKPYPRGALIDEDAYTLDKPGNYWCMVFNHEKPFIQLVMAMDNRHEPNNFVIAGDIYIPRVATDTYVEGVLSFYPVVPRDQNADFTSSGFFREYWQGAHFVTPDGNRGLAEGLTANLYSNTKISLRYSPNATGDFDRIPIKVAYTDQTVDKGVVDPDIAHMAAQTDQWRGQIFPAPNGNAMLKVEAVLLVPWVHGVPVPFYGWPLDWQTRPGEPKIGDTARKLDSYLIYGDATADDVYSTRGLATTAGFVTGCSDFSAVPARAVSPRGKILWEMSAGNNYYASTRLFDVDDRGFIYALVARSTTNDATAIKLKPNGDIVWLNEPTINGNPKCISADPDGEFVFSTDSSSRLTKLTSTTNVQLIEDGGSVAVSDNGVKVAFTANTGDLLIFDTLTFTGASVPEVTLDFSTATTPIAGFDDSDIVLADKRGTGWWVMGSTENTIYHITMDGVIDLEIDADALSPVAFAFLIDMEIDRNGDIYVLAEGSVVNTRDALRIKPDGTLVWSLNSLGYSVITNSASTVSRSIGVDYYGNVGIGDAAGYLTVYRQD